MAFMRDAAKLLFFVILTTKPRFDAKGSLTPERI